MTPTGSSRTSQSNEMTLAAGSESTTVIEFRDDVVVSGTVTRAGEGMREVNVSFRSGDETGPSSSTDSEDVPAVIFTDWPPTPLPKTSRTKAVAVEVDEPSAPTVLGSSERVMDVGVPACSWSTVEAVAGPVAAVIVSSSAVLEAVIVAV